MHTGSHPAVVTRLFHIILVNSKQTTHFNNTHLLVSSNRAGAKSEDFDDPDLVTPEVIDDILEQELGRGFSRQPMHASLRNASRQVYSSLHRSCTFCMHVI